MTKVDITQHLMPPPEIAEAIKKEFSLESEVLGKPHTVVYGCTNPEFRENSEFILGKQGKGYYWGFVEDGSENSHNFLILGNPLPYIRLHMRGEQLGDYRSHNAHVQILFSTARLIGEKHELVQHYWNISYFPFTEILTPMSGGTYMQNMKDQVWFSLSGVGIWENTPYETGGYVGEHIPNPLGYLNPVQVNRFFRDLVADLQQASPTAAQFVREKFTELRS